MVNPIDPQQMKLWFLGTSAIIISAMKIPFRNPNFITFTLITSFPLYFVSLVPGLVLNQDELIFLFIKAFAKGKILTVDTSFSTIKTVQAVKPPVIQFPKVYIDDLIDFLTAVATIYASSTILTRNDHKASMSLRHILRNFKTKSRWRDGVFTYIAMSMLHKICLPYVINCIYVQQLHLSSFKNSLIFKCLHVMVPAVTFAIWVEYNTWWKLSVTVSMLELEEQRGFQAFSTSSQLRKGNKLRGFILMLLLSILVWPALYRGQSFYVPSGHIGHVFLQASVLYLGKVMTWMVFTVYYLDCKKFQQKRLSPIL